MIWGGAGYYQAEMDTWTFHGGNKLSGEDGSSSQVWLLIFERRSFSSWRFRITAYYSAIRAFVRLRAGYECCCQLVRITLNDSATCCRVSTFKYLSSAAEHHRLISVSSWNHGGPLIQRFDGLGRKLRPLTCV